MARKAPAKRRSEAAGSQTSDAAAASSKTTGKTRAAAPPVEHGFPELNRDQKMAWSYFLKAYKVVVDAVDKDLRAGSEITLAEYEILLGVSAAGGRIRFIDLARNTLLSQSRISRQIDALQAKGLLKREITSSDRRATFAIMTPKGAQAWEMAQDPFAAAFHKHFMDLIPSGALTPFTRVLELLMKEPAFYQRSVDLLRQARAANGLPTPDDL